ncbi:MAG: succinate dehydrogenase assembly factor 2, partial [Proteobacteria bacterium]|nr:succinate dehydrogenase assembly factor 2 [Pseudomonadota bacterium]
EALLQQGDNDLYNWITGKAPVPAAHDLDLMAWLKKFNNVP